MVEYDLTSTFDTQLQIKEPRVRLNNGIDNANLN